MNVVIAETDASVFVDSHAALMVGDVRFHHACLKCCICRQALDGKMVTLDKENKPYCSKDYDK